MSNAFFERFVSETLSGRVTVTKIGSVKTPRNVDVAVDYDDVVRGFSREATSDVARLRSSRALFREREHRE